MLAKKYRLKEYEVSRVFKKGRPYFGEYWALYLFSWKGVSSKFGVSISRKHSKLAVRRNAYRRGLYESMRGELNNPGPHFHAVFMLKKGIIITEKIPPEVWLQDASHLLQKGKLALIKNIS